VQENLFRLQENARFAMYFLSKDIRRAGLLGCPSLRTMSGFPNVVAEVQVIPPLTQNTAVSGSDSISGNWNANACGAGNACITGSDAININFSESCGGNVTNTMVNPTSSIQIPATNTCNISATDAVLVSNCSSADIFRSTSVGSTINHLALSDTYSADAELFVYHAYTYFIRTSTSGGADRSLWRLDNTRTISGSNPTELIEGIEDMQILYGVDLDDDDDILTEDPNAPTTSPDGPADYYVTSDNVPDIDNGTPGTAPDGTPDWYRVVSIRISLLVATLEDNVASENLVYTYNGATTAPSDRKIRRVFNTTIALRNRLG
jgi:type IV pilus assembly protein PilW